MPEPVGELTAATEELLHPSIAANPIISNWCANVCATGIQEDMSVGSSGIVSFVQLALHACAAWR